MTDEFRPAALAPRNIGRAARFRPPYWKRNFGMRLRDGISAVLLCVALILLPFLATLDVGVAVGCRDIGRPACLQLVSHSFALPAMEELGMSE
jgi:hypothetical protein